MIEVERVAVVLLAAGLSTRFGAGDKLAHPLGDLPLGLHAARTLDRLPFAAKIAVTRREGLDYSPHGFRPVVNLAPELGLSGSIRLGIAAARHVEPLAVLIALADMPFITIQHVGELLRLFDAQHPIVASSHGGQSGPPVIFDATFFEALSACEGDLGARMLIRDATLVATSYAELIDVDTPADLSASRTRKCAET